MVVFLINHQNKPKWFHICTLYFFLGTSYSVRFSDSLLLPLSFKPSPSLFSKAEACLFLYSCALDRMNSTLSNACGHYLMIFYRYHYSKFPLCLPSFPECLYELRLFHYYTRSVYWSRLPCIIIYLITALLIGDTSFCDSLALASVYLGFCAPSRCIIVTPWDQVLYYSEISGYYYNGHNLSQWWLIPLSLTRWEIPWNVTAMLIYTTASWLIQTTISHWNATVAIAVKSHLGFYKI